MAYGFSCSANSVQAWAQLSKDVPLGFRIGAYKGLGFRIRDLGLTALKPKPLNPKP